LVEHHRAIAAGGAAMTTVAYCSVSPEGRSYDTQMWMRPEIVGSLQTLTEAVHAQGAAAAIQLGHCGYFANAGVIGGRPLAPSVRFNTYGLSFSRAMTPSDMTRVADDFARATALAVEAGFDAVEIHMGHGYLLSQYLSPYTNRRKDAWGGTLENRLRFPLQVIARVLDVIPADKAVIVKMNLTDGFRGGLGIDEAIQVAKSLEESGVHALVLSGGFVSKTPLYMLRGEVPLKEMMAVQKIWWQRLGLYLFGRFFVQAYPYTEMFFFEEARRVRGSVTIPLVLLGGIRSQANIQRAMDAGFDFVSMARALIHDPDLVQKMARGAVHASGCIPCNRCIAEMDRGGVRCVLPAKSDQASS